MSVTEPTSLAYLRWLGRDLAAVSGAALLRAQVEHVLMSEGEMPWRTAFDAGLDRLRHRRSDAVTVELARVRIQDALGRWLPDVILDRVDVVAAGGALTIRVDVRRGTVAAAVSLAVS